MAGDSCPLVLKQHSSVGRGCARTGNSMGEMCPLVQNLGSNTNSWQSMYDDVGQDPDRVSMGYELSQGVTIIYMKMFLCDIWFIIQINGV